MFTVFQKTLLTTAVVAVVFTARPATALELNPLSYMKDALEAVVEDRSIGDIARDTEINAKIVAFITDQMGTNVISFNTDVYEQDVMITGVVEQAELKDQAGRIVKGVSGVKRLYNDVLVIPKIKQDKGLVEGFVDDSVIEGKINIQLIDATAVNVTNFRWRSVGGRVFLFGRALSKDELNKVVRVIKGIKNVTQVTNRAKIKPKG